jgi:hypothetical protein
MISGNDVAAQAFQSLETDTRFRGEVERFLFSSPALINVCGP